MPPKAGAASSKGGKASKRKACDADDWNAVRAAAERALELEVPDQEAIKARIKQLFSETYPNGPDLTDPAIVDLLPMQRREFEVTAMQEAAPSDLAIACALAVGPSLCACCRRLDGVVHPADQHAEEAMSRLVSVMTNEVGPAKKKKA